MDKAWRAQLALASQVWSLVLLMDERCNWSMLTTAKPLMSGFPEKHARDPVANPGFMMHVFLLLTFMQAAHLQDLRDIVFGCH